MENPVLEVCNALPRNASPCFDEPVGWRIGAGEQWAVLGPNGAGKTTLAAMLAGETALSSGAIALHGDPDASLYRRVKLATFHDIYSGRDPSQMYYQQRWNSTDEASPAVRDLLCEAADGVLPHEAIALFGIEDLLGKPVILLSSGELRKYLIVRTLLTRPEVLILDNPYIGLDAPSREVLDELLERLKAQGLPVVLLLSDPRDVPAAATHVLPVGGRRVGPGVTRDAFFGTPEAIARLFPETGAIPALPDPKDESESDYDLSLDMRKIHIAYGSRVILDGLDWQVARGEKWSLQGPNGSGKSTLLSLVCADNPQAYANDFSLFGRKRGTGESIWDIKRRIGYLSPEMHLHYQYNDTGLEVVGSGLFDTVGLYRRCSEEQLQTARAWMDVFGIEDLADLPFLKLSFGEQRLALLARAFVKDPELLILDEPLHGLDVRNKERAGAVIAAFCERPGKTLIYVTHYAGELPPCVDRRLVLKKN